MISKDLDRIGAFQDRDEAKVGLVTNRIKAGKNVEPVALDRFRQLLKQGLQRDNSRKLALHALIDKIKRILTVKQKWVLGLGREKKGCWRG